MVVVVAGARSLQLQFAEVVDMGHSSVEWMGNTTRGPAFSVVSVGTNQAVRPPAVPPLPACLPVCQQCHVDCCSLVLPCSQPVSQSSGTGKSLCVVRLQGVGALGVVGAVLQGGRMGAAGGNVREEGSWGLHTWSVLGYAERRNHPQF